MIRIIGNFIPLLLAIVGVAVVIYLSYLFSRYISIGAAKFNAAKYMNIVDRLAVGQDRMLLIIELGEKYYLTSVTSQNIQILKELDKEELKEIKPVKNTLNQDGNFKSTFQSLLASKNREKI